MIMIDNIEMPLSMGNFIIPLKRKALNSVWQPRISYNPLVKHVKCWSDGRGQTLQNTNLTIMCRQ